MAKSFKRKFIFEIGSDCETPSDIPEEYSTSKFRWLCDVSAEGNDGVVDEYTITPDRKIYLNHFFDIMQQEINKLMDDQVACWGVKIYRLTPNKR